MKRYRDFNGYLREIYGERVQKISLDAGLSCPNRDGLISDKGCLFCNARGSGTGAMIEQGLSISEQAARGRRFAEKRYGARKFIAYFQSFSNTYGPVDRLERLYKEAMAQPGMVGLFVATRPDCIDREKLDLLRSFGEKALVWIEYGLQSVHDETLRRINRGHGAGCFLEALRMTDDFGLNACVHIILGLPGETREMMLETARFLAALPISGIKIHVLYVLKQTPLARLYERGGFRCLERSEYVDLVVDVLELLPAGCVIQRLTGDPVGQELEAPHWALEKGKNLEAIRRRLEERNTWQGKKHRAA